MWCRILNKGAPLLKRTIAAANCHKTSRGPRSWLASVEEELEALILSRAELHKLRGKTFLEGSAAVVASPLSLKRLFRKIQLADCVDPYFDLDGEVDGPKTRSVDPYAVSSESFICQFFFAAFATEPGSASHLGKVHGTITIRSVS